MSDTPIQLGRKSTAASTAFVTAKLEHAGRSLYFDGNQKITAGNGTFDSPKPNAFSLVHVEDCPGSTPTCRASCYVHELEQAERDLAALYRHNSTTIREILALSGAEQLAWARAVGAWIRDNAIGGFRWHVSGDIFDAHYASWIVAVCDASPMAEHWLYTRSFDHVWLLTQTANLAVNLSCDVNNYGSAKFTRALHAPFKDLRLCYMTVSGYVPGDLPEGSVVFPDYSLRGSGRGSWFEDLSPEHKRMVCPVDVFSKSASIRCGVCKKCF